MLDNAITLTYNAASVTMRRVNQDNYTSVYRGEVSGEALILTIKHTIVPRGKPGTSHMIRLDKEVLGTDGELIRMPGVWQVYKTFDGTEDRAELLLLGAALNAFVVADSGDTTSNASRVVGGES